MGFVGLWNNWIVNYYRDFSFLFAFLVVIPIIYRRMMSDDYRKEEFAGDENLKKTYANGVCFVLIFGFFHSFYSILSGKLTLSIFIYFLILSIVFIYSRFCKNIYMGLLIKLLLICFLWYFSPTHDIKEKINYYKKIDMQEVYANAKVVNADIRIYHFYPKKSSTTPTRSYLTFNGDDSYVSCDYIVSGDESCKPKHFDKMIDKNVIIRISNDGNNYLLAVYDASGNEIYNFYNHYKNRQKSEYIWAWFYRIEYYIFFLFLVLLPLPKKHYDDELFDDEN